ncbi:citramalyl-CoA lyase, mitochondrial-like [Acomys russatus]|uniref:citramalyl-CoA lyase, mitochondrial-like n=1 Tax=Acomys russatus TaxID=60746 RepID=UPI0021E32383|nr:citramalyl-CoA lyase, mitochondrial-like [Acomys russatus]
MALCVLRNAVRGAVALPRLKAALEASVCRPGYSSLSGHKYVPRRAVLYVPGDDEKKIRKIPSLKVDCAALDCEDGVAENKKVPTGLVSRWREAGLRPLLLSPHCSLLAGVSTLCRFSCLLLCAFSERRTRPIKNIT